MKYKIAALFAFALSVLSVGNANAQEILTLEEAIRITLERNYDILLVKNDLEIDKNNVNRANAGMLPYVEEIGRAHV